MRSSPERILGDAARRGRVAAAQQVARGWPSSRPSPGVRDGGERSGDVCQMVGGVAFAGRGRPPRTGRRRPCPGRTERSYAAPSAAARRPGDRLGRGRDRGPAQPGGPRVALGEGPAGEEQHGGRHVSRVEGAQVVSHQPAPCPRCVAWPATASAVSAQRRNERWGTLATGDRRARVVIARCGRRCDRGLGRGRDRGLGIGHAPPMVEAGGATGLAGGPGMGRRARDGPVRRWPWGSIGASAGLARPAARHLEPGRPRAGGSSCVDTDRPTSSTSSAGIATRSWHA